MFQLFTIIPLQKHFRTILLLCRRSVVPTIFRPLLYDSNPKYKFYGVNLAEASHLVDHS